MIGRIKIIGSIIVILAGYGFFNSCNGVKDTLKGRCIYAGKLSLIDTLGGKGSVFETDSIIKVYVYSVEDPSHYLYQVNTKEKGNFSMDFLERNKEYSITADCKVNNIKYSGSHTYKADKCSREYTLSIVNDTVKMTLYAEIGKRNLVTYTVKDQAGAVVPKATGCLFSSEVLFNTQNCLNANYSTISSETGKLSYTNLPEGHYYLYVNKKLDTTATAPMLSGIADIHVSPGVIYERDVKIK
jgi:hypothetical protein